MNPDANPVRSELEAAARAAFAAAFGGEPVVIARAPGRVELLGNHTDYNGGLVACAAIDRFTVVAGRVRPGRIARVRSVQFEQDDEFSIDAITPTEKGSWSRYARGVCWALSEQSREANQPGWPCGPLASGFEAVIVGDVPLGAGLSSSASLQAALATFLLGAGLVRPDPATADEAPRMGLAASLRRSENQFVGVGSGIMDQFASLFGRADHALRLDCRDLSFEALPLGDPAPAIVVCDSKTSRRLADGMYDRRKAECDGIVAWFRTEAGRPEVMSLRDLTLADLEAAWGRLDRVGRKRARHVLAENERVRRGAEALRRGDVMSFGRLMSESHASSRDDFENSAPALDSLIESAAEAPGFLGGKLSGAGWAGCTVNLVAAEQAAAFAEAVRAGYTRRTGTAPDLHICRAAEGAGIGG
jgi:galactokinase